MSDNVHKKNQKETTINTIKGEITSKMLKSNKFKNDFIKGAPKV